jgi:hypothetical protein
MGKELTIKMVKKSLRKKMTAITQPHKKMIRVNNQKKEKTMERK